MDDVIAGIYKITNKFNNKCYIGQSKDIYQRWKQHKNSMYKDNSAFHIALRTIGPENFIWEIIEKNIIDENLRNKRERYWIQYYKSLINENGYNSQKGGNANNGCLPIQRKVLQYDLDGNFLQEYESLSEASRQTGIAVPNLVECCQSNGRILSKKYMWFYYIDNYSKKINPYKRSNAKEVEQYSLQGEYIRTFSSLHEAALAMKGTEEGIQSCTSHKTKTAYGFLWKLKEDPIKITPYIDTFNNGRKKVLKIDKKTNKIINKYESIQEAAKINSIHFSTISKWCNHRTRQPKGNYYWIFEEEYLNGI